jgi:MoaA/NifB/PqqE/SkfB family radical SAM enzyme
MTIAENVHDASALTDLRFLWLEITGKCNLFCAHCYAESGPQSELYGDMAYGDWTRVIDEAAELGCRRVQFIGGEPTMHPRLEDLLDHTNQRGFAFIEVYTNATRLGKKLLGCFQRRGVHVATSFYSDDPVVHEQVTRGEGSWERTVHGIESVLAAGLPIRVGVIETEGTVGHGPRAVDFLRTLGVHNVRVDRARGVGRGRLENPVAEGERYEELCGQCWKGKLCVTSSGEAFPCVFARATGLGDVRSGLASILRTQKLTAFRLKVRALNDSSSMCHPSDHGPEPAASGLSGFVSSSRSMYSPECNPDHCNPTAPCNPDHCNPTVPCNPQHDCNPDHCNPN